jgi:hypothetical protein
MPLLDLRTLKKLDYITEEGKDDIAKLRKIPTSTAIILRKIIELDHRAKNLLVKCLSIKMRKIVLMSYR